MNIIKYFLRKINPRTLQSIFGFNRGLAIGAKLEIFLRPGWKNAPEWANYLVMDDDGWWCWFSERPMYDGMAYGSFSNKRESCKEQWNTHGCHDYERWCYKKPGIRLYLGMSKDELAHEISERLYPSDLDFLGGEQSIRNMNYLKVEDFARAIMRGCNPISKIFKPYVLGTYEGAINGTANE